MNWYKYLLLIDFLFSPILIFSLSRFKTGGSHQTCFAQLSFCLTSGIFWYHLKFYRISHKLRSYLAITIKNFWYFSRTILDNIWRYLTIFEDIWWWKRSHLKPGNCRPKNIAKYPHLLSSGKRALKQNIMNLGRLKIFL